MSKENNAVNGYILAGGKSSRMGMDKGLVMLGGKPAVQYVIEQLQPLVTKTVIVSDNREYEKFGLEVIGDVIKNSGPAGGILAALQHSDSKKNFVVSCDMPFITAPAITFLIKNSFQNQITLPVYKQHLEPLFGIYATDCFSGWQQLIEQQVFKLQDLISHFSFLKIETDDNPVFNELLFTNMNTQEDLEMAIKNLKHGS